MKRKLELAKREIKILRGMQRLNVASGSEVLEENQRTNILSATGTSMRATEISARTTEMSASVVAARGMNSNEAPSRPNITSIAELLGSFDGRSDIYETWERQVIFLKNTFRLSDEMIKIMIGLRLKGKASEFLHSKVEYITMSVDDLLSKLRGMFYNRPNRVLARKQFEQRVWKRDESFSSYLHDKIILANHISIDESEIIEYVVEGIPN